MENLSLVSSPKLVLGLSPRNPFVGLINRNGNGRQTKPISSLSVRSFFQPPKATRIIVAKKTARDCFASVSKSSGQQTSSVGVNPPTSVPPSSSQVGSPLFWIGVGVGLSALFSWVADRAKKFAMQKAMEAVTQQMSNQNNPFVNPAFSPGNSAFSPGSPFPFPPPPTVPSQKTPITSTTVASQSVTDVDSTNVDSPPSSSVKENIEPEKGPKKYAFVDVSPDETVQKNAFESYKDSFTADSTNYQSSDPVSQNGTTSTQGKGASESSSTSQKTPLMSVEALEKMMEDPTVQKMVYPYLPEEMRNPTTFKWMLQNPEYRQQLQDMLGNMGGSPEWDNRMMDSLKNFDLSSPEVKQQFDQIGLTPEEVISKIMANPDVAMAFQNPRVQAAIMECSQNPLSIAKYQNDKEVMDVFTKISELFPGVTG